MRRGRQIFWSLVPAFAAVALVLYALAGAALLAGGAGFETARLHGVAFTTALGTAVAGVSAATLR